ncbi:Esterase lipase thioesterase active site [Coemansia sp. RSA 2049]|nr:Esterase lipase thioesterase active site [Coemansia sp. RSA 2049]
MTSPQAPETKKTTEIAAETATVAPYGSWRSPITADKIATAAKVKSMVRVDPAQPTQVYWLETRPAEGGRYTLLRTELGSHESPSEITPGQQWNVRTAVHEYGGGAYAVYDGMVVFSNWETQGVYLIHDSAEAGRSVVRIGEMDDMLRYAAFAIHPSKKFVVCVREDHRESDIEARAAIVAICIPSTEDVDDDPVRAQKDVVLYDAADFVSSPVFSPIANEIAFFAWNHPDMSWDATTLYRATLALGEDGTPEPRLVELTAVAGGNSKREESVYQPRFDADGVLHFISDRNTGFWSPHHVDAQGSVAPSLREPIQAEFAEPEWRFGNSSLQPVPGRKHSVAVAYAKDGAVRLGVLDTETGTIAHLEVPPWTAASDVQVGALRSGEAVVVVKAGQPTAPTAIYACRIDGDSAVEVVGEAQDADKGDDYAGYLSVPREIAFETRLPPFGEHGSGDAASDGGRGIAYAFYYAPANSDYAGEAGKKPPLLVVSHGGPTGAADTALKLSIQFWTSRGFAVADVNYGGSTGFGRAYCKRLYGELGRVDVQDCCAAALHLAAQGLADRRRLCIMGASSGGYTALACLAFRPDVFAVGASHYGISDLELLAKETHKFEARYPDRLVGPYPEARALYAQRSPLHYADAVACPVVFFQGLDDRVVPPNQTSAMAAALRRNGVRVALLEFAGEQHGFRRRENIVRALEAQLLFFGRVLGFSPADAIAPLPIDNE